MSKYEVFIEQIISETPEFMIIKKENEKYLLFDRFVNSLSDNAMPWLFKVYLDKNYNILNLIIYNFIILYIVTKNGIL
ncbi:MAG: hypothetical protein ACRDD7_06910 [Peptostreptococcaceae bacterium]